MQYFYTKSKKSNDAREAVNVTKSSWVQKKQKEKYKKNMLS